jgi:hypothetical protein
MPVAVHVAADVQNMVVSEDSHNTQHRSGLSAMKLLRFLVELPIRFIFSLLAFTFLGWIGWLGIILVLLRFFGVIHWHWWLAALPLEYGVIYCVYMIIDGALYRAGLKDVGRYARSTSGLPDVGRYARSTQAPPQHEQSKIQEIIAEGPERIGVTIDAWSEDPNRRPLAQALVDAALGTYCLLYLACSANKKVNAHVTIKRWRDAGLTLPAEGTPEFFPSEKAKMDASTYLAIGQLIEEMEQNYQKREENHQRILAERKQYDESRKKREEET